VSIARGLAVAALALLASAAACRQQSEGGRSEPMKQASSNSDDARSSDPYRARREHMVAAQIEARGVSSERVLRAMRQVPRHEFVPEVGRTRAYQDSPLGIGYEQTISQPFIVAAMAELAGFDVGDKVLEIGTGSGYSAAVLAAAGGQVFSIEILEPLGLRAAADLKRLGYEVQTRIGDGYAGWPEQAPFDAIVVTAAPPSIPQPLIDQLAIGGVLIIPVGDESQDLRKLVKRDDGTLEQTSVFPVRFVPMTGQAQEH